MQIPPPLRDLADQIGGSVDDRRGPSLPRELEYASRNESYSSAPTCEGTPSIDLAWLRRRRMLVPGRISTITWSSGGGRTGEISLAQVNGVRLLYNLKGPDGTKTNINEFVPFAYTATMFGGRRQWFMCLKCGQRCRRIFGGRYFRCRQC